jgi:uncharacterized protein
MQFKNNTYYYSASDLATSVSCQHLVHLKKMVADGKAKRPVRKNLLAETLQKRGQDFESAYLEGLRLSGKSIVEIDNHDVDAREKTIKAMQEGVDVIYQARMELGCWHGWADFMVRVEKPSNLGSWSYEIQDTKLTTATKAAAVIQIALYSEILTDMQGVEPDAMHIRHPKGFEEFRLIDYMSYYRVVKNKFLETINQPTNTYPDPVAHCDVCPWSTECDTRRRQDDHLSLVAGMRKSHVLELNENGISTLEQLATQPLPLPFRPKKGNIRIYNKLREQARLQNEARITGQPTYEMLSLEEGKGFFLLPEPCPDDIFLDLEGDPFVLPSGREYLFGYWYNNEYTPLWAETEEAERDAFEAFIDFAYAKYIANPDMHIYHYGAYETSALKRLMLRYATRIEQTESLLRSETFVDIHLILRQSLRAGVEKYSLKHLERHHGYQREADLNTVGPAKAYYEMLLQTGQIQLADENMKEIIQVYNQDDCKSTVALFGWLCQLRSELRNNGHNLPAPEKPNGEASEKQTQHQQRVQPLFNNLIMGLPAEQTTFTPLQKARYFIAHLLDWFGREKKKLQWEKFRINRTEEDELLDEPSVLAYLEFTGSREKVKRSYVDTYMFPDQEFDLREGDAVLVHNTEIKMTVYAVDRANQLVQIKKSADQLDLHPSCIFAYNDFPVNKKVERLVQLAELINTHGINVPTLQCAVDLILGNRPRVTAPPEEDAMSRPGLLEWTIKLDNSVLPIQGPPGTGKTFTGKNLVIDLIRAGKRVGITALSHKVISKLLNDIHNEAIVAGMNISMLQKPGQDDDEQVPWQRSGDIDFIAGNLSRTQVIAGTSSMWSDIRLSDSVDYLIVDEAGQLSLADTLVSCFATKNLVLLGDPQQLKQPLQGIHPDGVDVSALEHILCGHQTLAPDQGLFLKTTHRMHPSICKFNSKLYYDGKLKSAEELNFQKVTGNCRFTGSGLFHVPVVHQGNTTCSPEEAEATAAIFRELTKGDVYWTDKYDKSHLVRSEHIRIITPYNSQRYEIAKRIRGFSEIGTVDKFQGQEAPITIYSTVTSSVQDISRGMDFLYNGNRMNVAISRAMGIFILVGSPELFAPECKTPAQMKLANGFAYFLENSTVC